MSDDLDLLKRLVAQVSRQGDHHTLLTRQLKKAGIADSSVLPEQAAWEKLVKLVDDSYRENDRDRYTLERSLALCSDEMQELQGKLQKQNSVLNQVVTRYVSEEVATEILKDPDKKLQLGGEMMLVSYLHVRISAPSTQKSRDARLVFKTLNRLFQHVVPMVLDGHGTFDKYLGDALLCFFGAPVAHDDDAFRAVRTAVRMRSAIEDLIDGSQDLLRRRDRDRDRHRFRRGRQRRHRASHELHLHRRRTGHRLAPSGAREAGRDPDLRDDLRGGARVDPGGADGAHHAARQARAHPGLPRAGPEIAARADVVVIGAGAAGLLAAARAAESGARTLLLEKNPRAGVKILMSGGTRCNLTQATDARGIADAFGAQGKFLMSPLHALSPEELLALIEAEGVKTKVEPTGKVFPRSDRAADVLGALLRRLERSGATLALGEPALRVDRDEDGFAVRTPRRELRARRLIVTTGGRSYPSSGTTGDGYGWMRALGHTVVTPRPALVPLLCEAPWVRELRGVALSDAEIAIRERDAPRRARPLAEARGALLFTHFGLSGPAVLDVSRVVSAHPRPRDLVLACEPRGAIPRRLARALDAIGAQSTPIELPLAGTRGFRNAEVTAGGVALDEVDSRSMASKRVPGLYLAGEILDVDGPIGGYNFQAAFSTGWLAGASAAR
ncbi:MAG: aminoacetone oxidase family FAD-binding enzyme [Acidobacteriota bacterium]